MIEKGETKVAKGKKKKDMDFFTESEFQGFYKQLNKQLKKCLDAFRKEWGYKVVISPASGAVGRHLGPLSNSDHNIDKWEEVRAVDLFPKREDEKPLNRADMKRCVEIATKVGFTAIGIYPKWKPDAGLHLGIRPNRTKGKPALWAGLPDPRKREGHKQVYVALERGLKEMPNG